MTFPKVSIFWLSKDFCQLSTLEILKEVTGNALRHSHRSELFCPGLNKVDRVEEGPKGMYLRLSCSLGHSDRGRCLEFYQSLRSNVIAEATEAHVKYSDKQLSHAQAGCVGFPLLPSWLDFLARPPGWLSGIRQLTPCVLCYWMVLVLLEVSWQRRISTARLNTSAKNRDLSAAAICDLWLLQCCNSTIKKLTCDGFKGLDMHPVNACPVSSDFLLVLNTLMSCSPWVASLCPSRRTDRHHSHRLLLVCATCHKPREKQPSLICRALFLIFSPCPSFSIPGLILLLWWCTGDVSDLMQAASWRLGKIMLLSMAWVWLRAVGRRRGKVSYVRRQICGRWICGSQSWHESNCEINAIPAGLSIWSAQLQETLTG